jgi:hypothetical protein
MALAFDLDFAAGEKNPIPVSTSLNGHFPQGEGDFEALALGEGLGEVGWGEVLHKLLTHMVSYPLPHDFSYGI